MNIVSYGAKFDEANWVFFCEIGLTPSYLRSERYGMAGVQQNIAYSKELFAGDVIEIRSQVLEVAEKRLRVRHEMRNIETGAVAANMRDHGGASRQAGAQVLRVPAGHPRRRRGPSGGQPLDARPRSPSPSSASPSSRPPSSPACSAWPAGMILLGVMLIFMDVAPAMVLFGIIQMASNGWRATLWWRYVDWSIVWRFLVGSTTDVPAACARSPCCRARPRSISRSGCCPSPPICVPKRVSLDITRPGVPYVAGALIIVLQLMAGAAGHILDVFFQKSQLDRKTIVATKAVTQVTGHVYRILYFGSFGATFDTSIPWWAYAAAIALAFAGTSLAATVLMRMTDDGFRMWSRRVTMGVSVDLSGARAVAGGGAVKTPSPLARDDAAPRRGAAPHALSE